MAAKPEKEIMNVLVLGTSGVEILQFVKLFGVYLQSDSYEEAKMWETDLSLDKDYNGTLTSIILVGDKKIKLTCIPCDKYVYKQVIQFMIHFMKGQKLSTIIYLVKPSEQNDIWVHKTCLFSKLENFQNILNVVSLHKDFYNYEEFIDCTCRKERSEFYLEEGTFYSISKENWQQSMDFCKKILESIAGDKCGLKDYCIQSVILEKSLIKLERDLLELLMLIYISGECYNLYFDDNYRFGFIIEDYKKKVTTCYGTNCVKWKEYDYIDCKMKIPKICHGPCKCAESVEDVSKCMILDTPDKLCLKCNCSSDLHSNNYFNITCKWFKKDSKEDLTSTNNEKHIAINNLATFFLHNKQHQEINIEDIFLKLIDIQDETYKTIFDTFKKEFNDEVQKLENNSNPITCENVLISMKELYQIEKITAILPQFIQETFPDFEVEVTRDDINEPNKEATSKIPKFKSEKMEMEMLRNEIAELRQMLQNSNDLNSKLVQDMQALTKQHNLSQTKENTIENELN